jgi:hypothetical protein
MNAWEVDYWKTHYVGRRDGRHNLLFDRNEIHISQMAMDLFPFYLYVSFIHHIQDFHRAMSYTVGVLLCFVYITNGKTNITPGWTYGRHFRYQRRIIVRE